MAALADLAQAQQAQQAALADLAVAGVLAVWGQLDPDGLAESWRALRMAEQIFVTLATHQAVAVKSAPAYVAAALAEQGAASAPAGRLAVKALAGVASDGRPLESLVAQPLIRVLTALKSGVDVRTALLVGGAALALLARTQVLDSVRAAQKVAIATEPDAEGWVRMLRLPSCGRCAVLAGRWYRWNDGFLRHPGCDCIHVPASEDVARDVRTDPDGYFASLPRRDQDRYFTVAGAEAIRQGSDIGQVVNARRGARGLSSPGRLTDAEQTILRGGRAKGYLERVDVYGRQVYVTQEGTTRRGAAGRKLGAWSDDAVKSGGRVRRARTPRLMPESIIEIAGDDRDAAVQMLQRFGYIASNNT